MMGLKESLIIDIHMSSCDIHFYFRWIFSVCASEWGGYRILFIFSGRAQVVFVAFSTKFPDYHTVSRQ